MKHSCRLLIAGVCTAAAVAPAPAAGTFDDFSRYNVILSCKPFGSVPDVVAAPVNVAAAGATAAAAARSYKLCILRDSGKGTKVGFMDISSKPEKNYLLYVGGVSDDGIEVVSANMETRQAKLRKDGQEFDITMDPASGGGTPITATTGAPSPGVAVAAGFARTPAPPNSALARLRARRESSRAHMAVAPPNLTGEALQQRLQELQAQQIRRGGPTLPLPLSKEVDDRLVREGVLPPTEGQEHLAPVAPAGEPTPEGAGNAAGGGN
jgi:hypothetical protein